MIYSLRLIMKFLLLCYAFQIISSDKGLILKDKDRTKTMPVYFHLQRHSIMKKKTFHEPFDRLPGRVILFFHIPKTGGTSMTSLMKKFLINNLNNPFETVFMPVRTMHASDKLISDLLSLDVDPNLVMVAEIHRGTAHPFSLYAKYLPAIRKNIESQGGVLFTFTVLRDPVMIAISSYTYMMEQTGVEETSVRGMLTYLKDRNEVDIQVNYLLRNPAINDELYVETPPISEGITTLIPLMEEHFDDVLILEDMANHFKRTSRFIQNFYHVFNQSQTIRTVRLPHHNPSKSNILWSELQRSPADVRDVQQRQVADIKLYNYFREKATREPDMDIVTVLRLQKLPPKSPSSYPPVQTQQVLQYKPQNIFQITSQQSTKQRSHSKTQRNPITEYSAEKTHSADSSSGVEQMLKSRIENLMKSKELFQTKEFDAELKSAMRQYDEILQQNIAKKIKGQ